MPTPIEPNQPTNIGLAQTLSRLGSSNERLPSLNDLTPVLIMGDVSRTLAGEVFEARAVAVASWPSGVANFVFVALTARSAGGIVVEFLRWSIALLGAGMAIPSIQIVRPVVPLTGVPQSLVNTGGVPAVSFLELGPSGADPFVAGDERIALPSPFHNIYPGIGGPNDRFTGEIPGRVFVPAGEQIYLYAPIGQVVDATFVWRELADAQGTS